MQKFKVTGIDAGTNEVVGLDIEAESLLEAMRMARARGLRHVAVASGDPLEGAQPPAEAGPRDREGRT